jgi:hypothetical protein
MSPIVVDCNTNNVTIRALALHRFEIVTQFSDVAKRCTVWQFAMAPGRLSTGNFDHNAIYRVTFDTICEFDSRHIDCVAG